MDLVDKLLCKKDVKLLTSMINGGGHPLVCGGGGRGA